MKLISICIFTVLTAYSVYAQEQLNIDVNKSSIRWIGEYTFSFRGHDGYVNFKQGYFLKENEVIVGGTFIIDMNTITNTDIKSKDANLSLVDHLKNSDFFDVKKYPVATIVITGFEYFENKEVRVSALLTIKEISHPITFNGLVDYKKEEFTARFKINRQQWNINYKSKMKDSPISDAIGFEINIKL